MTRSSCRSSAFMVLGAVAVVAVVTACGGGSDAVPGMSGTALPADEETTITAAPTESDEAAESEPDRDGGDIDGDAALQDLADAPVADDPPNIVNDPPKVVDDHADTGDGATPVAVGGAVSGSVDYEYDIDFFVFEAEEGGLYRIDVSLGTLPDSVAVLYDAELYDGEESELAYNDDSEDGLNLASRIDWPVESAGTFYVAVRGWEENTGSYTLSVARVADPVDIADDHSNTADGATPVVVGEAVPGSVDYGGDVDFFVFEAEAGELYQVDVSLGTLPDSTAVLYDAEESELAYNDDYLSLASRIDWLAESAGTFYVAVEGYGGETGSYTLTVEPVIDDHVNSADGATPVVVGEAVPGSVDYRDDVDFFVFEAEAGEWYRIDVSLGTLPDSVAVLYDADESELAYNDDREDGLDLASRIDWLAESAGTFYVAVGGFDERAGSYTLTVDHVVDGEFETTGSTVPVAVSKAMWMPMDC